MIETKNIGQVSIPKHEIKEIREITAAEIDGKGEYKPNETFATRYFLSTNGLPIEKGDNYILWNLYGPDIQFSVSDHLGLGIMTSWAGIPIIGTAKYSINLGQKTNMAVGTLLGTGSWANPNFGIAVPFTAFTFGDRKANINFSGGYGAVWTNSHSEGRVLFSVAGMTNIGKKVSLVFDSFIIPATSNSHSFSFFSPGFRIQTSKGKFFQFGFAAIYENSEIQSALPMIQWFRKF